MRRARIAWTLLGVSLLAVLLWRSEPRELWSHARRADLQLLGAVFAVHLASLGLRILRWRALLAQAGLPVNDGRLLTDASFFGWFVNMTLPARLGELGRPAMYALRSGAPLAPAVTTMVVERVADVFVLAVGAGLALALLPPPQALPDAIAAGLRVSAALGAAAALALVVLARSGSGPARVQEGLAALRRGRATVALLAWTAAIWGSEALAAWLALAAFGLPGVWGAAIAQVAGVTFALGVLTVPGGVGVEQGVTVAVFLAYGLEEGASLATSLLLTFVALSWVVPGGLFAIARQGVGVAELRQLAAPGGSGAALRE